MGVKENEGKGGDKSGVGLKTDKEEDVRPIVVVVVVVMVVVVEEVFFGGLMMANSSFRGWSSLFGKIQQGPISWSGSFLRKK